MKTGKCESGYMYVLCINIKRARARETIGFRGFLREISRPKVGVLRFLVPAEVDLPLESSAA